MKIPAAFYRAGNLTLIAVLLFISNEWLFAFTKPAGSGFIHNLSWDSSPILLFASVWFVFTAVGLVLLCVLLRIWLLVRRPSLEQWFFGVPALFGTWLFLNILDAFTYSQLGFSSAVHGGNPFLNIGYVAVCIFVWLTLTRRLKSIKLTSVRWPTQAVLIITLVVCTIGGILQTHFLLTQKKVDPAALRAMPNIVLVTLESAVANFPEAMPFTTELSKESLVLENYFSNGDNTRNSLNTIISGMHPLTHRGANHLEPVSEDTADQNLIHYLRAAGYDYIFRAVHGGRTGPFDRFGEFDGNFLLIPGPTLFRHFQEERFVVQLFVDQLRQKLARLILDRTWPGPLPQPDDIRTLTEESHESGRPFFVHFHAMSSHGPYVGCKTVELCYIDSLENADFYTSKVYTALQQVQQEDHTIFIVVGDHAPNPQFLRKDAPHMLAMQRLSAMIRFPNAEHAGRYTANAESQDVLPTILDYLQAPKPAWAEGTSWLQNNPPKLILMTNKYFTVIACDRYLQLNTKTPTLADIPPVSQWPKITGHTKACGVGELPAQEEVMLFVQRFFGR